MTAVKTIEIACDYPDCDEVPDSSMPTVPEARAAAKKEGWIYRGGKDFCPRHADIHLDGKIIYP